MFTFEKMPLPDLGIRGLEADLTEEEAAIQEVAHRFAEDVMRPIAAKLDEMTSSEVVATESPLWDYMKQLQNSGILDLETLASFSDGENNILSIKGGGYLSDWYREKHL